MAGHWQGRAAAAHCATCLQAFKDGAVRFLICTDVAARGLDISGLPYVVNVTLPDRAEDYIHRVGRVGELMVHASDFYMGWSMVLQGSVAVRRLSVTTHAPPGCRQGGEAGAGDQPGVASAGEGVVLQAEGLQALAQAQGAGHQDT